MYPQNAPFRLPLGVLGSHFPHFWGVRFGVVLGWVPNAAKTAEKEGPKSGPKKGRSQGGPGPIYTLPAWPKEGDKGGGKPPPLGIGGLEDSKIWKKGRIGWKEVWKIGRKENGIYTQTRGVGV